MKIKSNKISRKLILIALFTILTGSIVGTTSAIGNNAKERLFINYEERIKNTAKPQYQKNSNGKTYGSASIATSPDQEPELILAVGVDGTEGYVFKKDLDGEKPKSVEEALAQQEKLLKNPGGRQIPLYKEDGQTIIGVFEISGFSEE